MQKIIYPLLVAFCCFLVTCMFISGCDLQSGNNPEHSFDSELEASIDGRDWKGRPEIYLSETILAVDSKNRNNDCNYESINFSMAEFDGEGQYPIYKNSYSQIIGCDGIKSYGYSSDTTGTATITDFDETSGVVEGEFSFELTADYNFDDVEYGESFTVTGHFRSGIIQSN